MRYAIKITAAIAIIVLLSFVSHKPYVGNWAGLASNQWIAYEDVQNGISTGALTTYGTDPALSATKWITKSEFQGWIMTTAVSGASNQWITKSDVSLITLPYTYTSYISASGNYGYATSTEACANYGSGTAITLYSSSSSITVGTTLYYLSGSTFTPFYLYHPSTHVTGDVWTYIAGYDAVRMSTTNSVNALATCTSYSYYIANRWDEPCSGITLSDVQIRSITSLAVGDWVRGDDGFKYQITSTGGSGTVTVTGGPFASCEAVL